MQATRTISLKIKDGTRCKTIINYQGRFKNKNILWPRGRFGIGDSLGRGGNLVRVSAIKLADGLS